LGDVYGFVRPGRGHLLGEHLVEKLRMSRIREYKERDEGRE
jgi:hypothetical protein